nr:hypothetical protein [Propionibacterium sp.]
MIEAAPRSARGMVTVELALVSGLVAAALGFAVWVLAQLVTLDLCQLTAHEVARQAARGDGAAVARAQADRPSGSTVTITDGGGATTVVVRFEPALLGFRVAQLEARATVLNEESA